MAEARDFHCYSHVFENLGKKTIPSDRAAVRLVIQKPRNRGHQSKRIPNWMSKHPVFCSLLQRRYDDHRFSTVLFGALAEFKVLLEKAKRLTIRELSRKTPDSIGAKLLLASTALRANRNRHLGTLMRCCEAWKLTKNPCFLPVLSLMKRGIPWKTKMNLEEDFVSIGEPFSRHAKKVSPTRRYFSICSTSS